MACFQPKISRIDDLSQQAFADPAGVLDGYLKMKALGVLGAGLTSHVLLVEEKDSKRKRAVKILEKGESKQGQRNAASFRREVAIMQALTHPNLMPCLAAVETSLYAYVVMPLCPGRTLLDKIRSSCSAGLLVYVPQIIQAVSALHGMGVSHGDLKPTNIMIYTPNRAVIGDFGFSRKLMPGEKVTDRRGTRAYMAPEMLGDSQSPVDPFKADIYALGVVLLELVLAQPIKREANDPPLCHFNIASSVGGPAGPLLRAMLEMCPHKRCDITAARESAWVRGISRGVHD